MPYPWSAEHFRLIREFFQGQRPLSRKRARKETRRRLVQLVERKDPELVYLNMIGQAWAEPALRPWEGLLQDDTFLDAIHEVIRLRPDGKTKIGKLLLDARQDLMLVSARHTTIYRFYRVLCRPAACLCSAAVGF